jgi:hypothetical protein
MVNGLHLYSAFRASGKALKALYDIAEHSAIHAQIHTATAATGSRLVATGSRLTCLARREQQVSCLAQGHLDTLARRSRGSN